MVLYRDQQHILARNTAAWSIFGATVLGESKGKEGLAFPSGDRIKLGALVQPPLEMRFCGKMFTKCAMNVSLKKWFSGGVHGYDASWSYILRGSWRAASRKPIG